MQKEPREKPGPAREARDHHHWDHLTPSAHRLQDCAYVSVKVDALVVGCDPRGGHARGPNCHQGWHVVSKEAGSGMRHGLRHQRWL